MKILILNDDFNINKTPPGIINSMIVNSLSIRYDISVLFPENINPKLYWINKNVELLPFQYPENSIKKFIDKIPKIRAIPNLWHGFDRHGYEIIKTWNKTLSDLLKKRKFDYIFIINGRWYPLFAMKNYNFEVPFIIHIHDPYPLIYAPKPYKNKFNLRDISLSFQLKKIIDKSFAVTFPSSELCQWMQKVYPALKSKNFVLPHIYIELEGVNQSDNYPSFPKEKFVLGYLGNLHIRKINFFVKAVKKLSEEDPVFKNKFLFFVAGNISKENLQELDKIKNQVMIFNKRINFNESIQIIRKTDLQLVIEAIMPTSPFMPSKLAYIIGNNKPILALTPEKSEIRIILGTEYPYLASPDNYAQIYEALKKAWEKWKSEKLELPDAKKLKNYVSPENFLARFEQIIGS